jgi:hypothetical protein
MGKHAAPRKPLFSRPAAQRATAVSLGTFVLCLGAAAPAVATTITPTPPPLPQPLSDAIQQVSDTSGLPNPIASDSTTTPKHRHSGKHNKKHQAPATPTSTVTRTSKPATHTVVPAYGPNPLTLVALHNARETRAANLAGQEPSMAGTPAVQRIAPAAARSLINLPGTPAQQDTERILLVAAATLLLGGLASGHLKAAQRRMIAW